MAKNKSLSQLDLSGLDKIQERWDVVNNRTIAWGYPNPNEMHEASGEKLSDVAKWNNEGTKDKNGQEHIPRREFMTISYLIAGEEMDKYTRQIALGVEKDSVNKAMDFVSKQLADTVRTAIGDFDYAANAPSTISRKSSDTPLIETGELYNKASGKVLEGDYE